MQKILKQICNYVTLSLLQTKINKSEKKQTDHYLQVAINTARPNNQKMSGYL